MNYLLIALIRQPNALQPYLPVPFSENKALGEKRQPKNASSEKSHTKDRSTITAAKFLEEQLIRKIVVASLIHDNKSIIINHKHLKEY